MQQKDWNRILAKLASGLGVAIDSPSSEEDNVIETLCKLVPSLRCPVYWWDISLGVREVILCEDGIRLEDHNLNWTSGNVTDFLDFIRTNLPPGLFVLIDFHPFIEGKSANAVVTQRLLKTTLSVISRTSKTRIVVLGQDIDLPRDLSGRMDVFSIPLPDETERRTEIELCLRALRDDNPEIGVPLASDEDLWTELLRASATLTYAQIGSVIKQGAILHHAIGRKTIDLFHQQKVENLLKTGITIEPPPEDEIGGLTELRQWLDRRKTFFASTISGIPAPKGLLAVGFPGTGKSLLAKKIGQILSCPVFKLSADILLGSLVGESEAKTKRFLQAIAAAAPGVLWIDEIEKLFAGMTAGNSGDGGTGARVFGQILTFLQENKSPIFVVATANDVSTLPSELMRKGRFDEIFFVDLPTEAERKEILSIHLNKWGTQNTMQELDEIADTLAVATGEWAGAELAELVKEAAMDAAIEGRPGKLVLADLQRHRSMIKPLSELESVKFEALRARTQHFRRASMEAKRTSISMGRRTRRTENN